MHLEFGSINDYEKYFVDNKVPVCRNILSTIENAYEKDLKEAIIFEISFAADSDIVYEVSVEKDDWDSSLQACMNILSENEATDDVIDAYLLRKKIKDS